MNGWEVIKYIAFLGLFISLLMCFWAYTYNNSLEGSDSQVYPYRSSIILILFVSSALFVLYFYSGIQVHKLKRTLKKNN